MPQIQHQCIKIDYFKAQVVTQDCAVQKTDVAAAMQFITAAKAELAAQRQKASELKSGMDIFNISQPAYKELIQNEKVSLELFSGLMLFVACALWPANIKCIQGTASQAYEWVLHHSPSHVKVACLRPGCHMQDVDLLEKVWGTVVEWQQLYNGWKDGRFGDLKVEEMEEAAGRVAKALQRLGREIKHWPVWTWIKVILNLCLPWHLVMYVYQMRSASCSESSGTQQECSDNVEQHLPSRVEEVCEKQLQAADLYCSLTAY